MKTMLASAVLSVAAPVLALSGASSALGEEWAKDQRTGCAVWHGHPKPPSDLTVTWSGRCKAGKGSGQGTFVLRQNRRELGRYTGPLVGGRPHGRGTFDLAGQGRYRGDFRRGRMHGRGVLAHRDGTRYEGGFANGIMHGRGVLTLPDGRRITGRFVNGMPAGN